MTSVVSLLTGFVRMVGHILTTSVDIISAALTVNYQIVASIIKLISSTTNAVLAVVIALFGAVCDVLYYLLEFMIEVFNLATMATKGLFKLGIILFDFVSIIIHATEEGIVYVGGCLVWLAKLIASAIGSCNSEIQDMLYVSWNGVCNVASYVALFCNTAASLVLDTCLAVVYFMQHVSFAAQNTVKSTVSSIDNKVESLIQFIYNIPVDAYIGLVFFSALIVFVKNIIGHISTEGFNFPFFQTRRSVEIELQGGGIDLYAIDSSDDEGNGYDNTDDEEQEDNYTDAEDDSENDTRDSISVSDNDQGNLDSEGSDGADEDNDGDGDSDSSDNTPVHIELPHGYAIRSRASPSPIPNSVKGNDPDRLVRQLESERDKRLCVVCQDQVKCVLVLPCKHMCLCVHCAHHITGSRLANRRICPLCRTRIEKVMNIYV